MLIGIELSSAAVSALDLVCHENDVLFFAEFRDPLHIGVGKRPDTAFTLNAFNQDAGHAVLADDLFQPFEVIRLRVDKARCQGEKVLVEHVLASCGERRKRTAVERVAERHDGVPLFAFLRCRIGACRLDGAFIRFSA